MDHSGFVHLHLHTEYSLLDGACRIKPLMEHLKALGQTAAAVTDHGNMYAAVEFWKEAKNAGIKPIIGCEAYLARRTRHDCDPQLDGSPYHVTLLCENNTGYRNLVKLVSTAYLDGFYSKPRIDAELLMQYHEGLICLSGCIAGEIPRLIKNSGYDTAVSRALFWQGVFGKDNYFIEIQDHGTVEEKSLLPTLYRLSAETGIPLAATNDCHYISREDAQMHSVLLCIQTGHTLDDENALSFDTNEYYVKSADEMAELFRGHEEALANTVRIAERCNVTFDFGSIMLPKYTIDGVSDNSAFLRSLSVKGMHKRYGSTPGREVTERLEYELSVITKMGYTDYFLIVWDFIRYARENDIPVGLGRGSGAGSLCAYCIGITGIDPIKFDLLFERFLNPERVSMPDFDIDFCIEGRQKVKDYVVKKYGKDRVSEIIAFDTLKARAAVRDVGRVLGIPYALCDKAAKQIDPRADLASALKTSEELAQMYINDKTVKRLIDTAMKIEGMPRHASTHAAGVVISAVPLSDIVPLQKNDDTVVTQYTMTVLESLGLLKMDFLGLRNLTVIRDTVREIRKYEPDFDISRISYSDSGVYRMLSEGDTCGVFQFESSGMTARLMELCPERLEDLIVILSLYRPGPMKSIPVYIENKKHPESIRYKHPLLKEILAETYGCMVYQEQVMEICRRLAGYSYGHADIVRRAMAKKKHDVMLKERESFVNGAVNNGIPQETANEIFDEMVSFASYAFNKSHAAAYACLAYQTAYLKHHYRGEYMAALMSSVSGSTEKLAEYIDNCRKNGIQVMCPDINRSGRGFSYREGKMYFGLSAVKNIGGGLSERIMREREENGDFRGLQDFCERMDGRELNRKAVENLIKAGAFDGLGLNRCQMLDCFEDMLDSAGRDRNGMIDGQLGFLDNSETGVFSVEIPHRKEYPPEMLYMMEKEAAGMYLSGIPLSPYEWAGELLHIRSISNIVNDESIRDGESVKLIVTLESSKMHITKKGERMGFIEIADKSGSIEGIVFPSLYAISAGKLTNEKVLCISGKISIKDDRISIICTSIAEESEFAHMIANMKLCIKTTSEKASVSRELTDICERYRGTTAVCFYLTDLKKTVTPKNKLSLRVDAESAGELKKIFSPSVIGLI